MASLDGPLQGAFVAPKAYLSLAVSGGTYTGSFYAKDVELAPRSIIKH
jgi:hypothetical protein